MVEIESPCYGFIIDTEQYSGNFERSLCAYITGVLGECEVGEEFQELFNEEFNYNADTGEFDNPLIEPLQEKIISRNDDHGCARPVSIWTTPGWFNHGHGGHYKDTPENELIALEEYKKEVRKSTKEEIERLESNRLLSDEDRKRLGWSEGAIRGAIAMAQVELEKVESLTQVSKYPAYQSVIIFFSEYPTVKEFNFMRERALKYNEAVALIEEGKEFQFNHPITITGFRLVKEETTYTELEIPRAQ